MSDTVSAGSKTSGVEMRGVRDARAQEYFDILVPPMRDVANAARDLLLTVEPRLDEVLKWGLPVYGQPKNLMSIVAHQKWVNFQLFNGAHLLGHAELIQGDGKNLRHVKLSSLGQVTEGRLESIIRESLALGFDRNIR